MSRLLPVTAILAATLTPPLFRVTAQESYLALTHVAVVDVTAGRAIPDQIVLIRGDRIAAVGTTVQVPAGARQVDLSGKFIVPGLFDMHAHAALAATQADEQSRRRTIETELRRRVREGVLGIRDMGAPFDAIAELKRESPVEQPLRPRVWLTGPPLAGPGGPQDSSGPWEVRKGSKNSPIGSPRDGVWSVFTGPGVRLAELVRSCRNNQVRRTTVGAILKAGGSLQPSSGPPHRHDVYGLTPHQLDAILSVPEPNPVQKPDRLKP